MRRNKPTCGARNRRGLPCLCKPEPGNHRCKFHGGRSTGPRTVEGKARSAANLALWLARSTPEERSQAAKKAAQSRIAKIKTRLRDARAGAGAMPASSPRPVAQTS